MLYIAFKHRSEIKFIINLKFKIYFYISRFAIYNHELLALFIAFRCQVLMDDIYGIRRIRLLHGVTVVPDRFVRLGTST